MSDYPSQHHPISGNPQRLPKCCICSEPVCLETSNTDEYGQALHEECYVLKLCMKKKEEWHVFKVWLNADFINNGGTQHASPSQMGTRSVTLAKRRGDRTESFQSGKDRRVRDMLFQRAKRVFWHPEPWKLELAAVVTALLLTCWIAYGDGQRDLFLRSLGLYRSTALQDQVLAPPKATTGKGRSRAHTVSASGEKAGRANLFQQFEGAENKVVHIGSDVTVRYFATKSIRIPSGSNREVSRRSVGEDVTIRDFTPTVRSIRN
jgi:hypothetical protein